MIKEAFVAAASNLLKLYINGKDLNPDSQELPKVQITGLPTECIIGTVQASGTPDQWHNTHVGKSNPNPNTSHHSHADLM